MKTDRLWVYQLVTRWLPETRFFGLKAALLRWCGAKIGSNVRISSSARFLGGGELVVGDDVWIGTDDIIHPVYGASVKIGNCCDIGPGVMILTGSHKIDAHGAHIAGEGTAADVEIGNGCWLGARSLVLPGVHISEKILVAAGSIVTNSVGVASVLVAGIPASIKKDLHT